MEHGRRRRWVRTAGALCLGAAVLVFLSPLHAWATRVHGLVLGIPFSIAWIMLGQAAVFAGLLLLFASEDDSAPTRED